MKDPNCGYCARGELLDAFGIVICELNVSTLILFKEQSHPGRCVVGVIAECECVFRRFNYVFDNPRLGIVFTVCFFPFETPCQVAVFPIEHIVSHGIYGRFCK